MGAGQPRFKSTAAMGYCCNSFAARTSEGTSLPIICAITGLPVGFLVMDSRIHFSKCDVLWTMLDALYHAYVAPKQVPPGAFVPHD